MEVSNRHIDKLLKKMNIDIEPEIVPVIPEHYAKYSQCYNNVEEKVRRDGGSIHYGWIIHQSKILCEAERHAVWELENEDLIDITPNPTGETEILFVSDNEYTYDGNDVDNFRMNITNNVVVDDFIQVCEARTKLYNLAERKNKDAIEMPIALANFTIAYTNLKDAYLIFINDGGSKHSQCLCGSKKQYKNCHGMILKKMINDDINAAQNFISKR